MWLSENMKKKEAFGFAEEAVVTVAETETAVLSDGEKRGVKTVYPGGFVWRPKRGDELLVMKDADGGSIAIGTVKDNISQTIEPGEAMVFTSAGYIHLKNSGEILLSGDLTVTGKINAVGGVFSNGTEIE